MYNDQPTNANSLSSRAHMKGFLAMDAEQGFWMIHSVPLFPDTPAQFEKNGFEAPDNANVYAQSFLCVTLRTATFETVAQALLIAWPQIYDSKISTALETTLPSLASVIANNKTRGPQAQTFEIATVGGKKFTLFVKNREWQNELYGQLVAPFYGDGLWTQTWQNGIGKLGSI